LGNRRKNAYQKPGLIVCKPALGNIRSKLFARNYLPGIICPELSARNYLPRIIRKTKSDRACLLKAVRLLTTHCMQ
jgi:hypothetical protein